MGQHRPAGGVQAAASAAGHGHQLRAAQVVRPVGYIATRIIRQPGIWVQHLTVFEPDDSMIEVAIAAITPVLPENPEEGKW